MRIQRILRIVLNRVLILAVGGGGRRLWDLLFPGAIFPRLLRNPAGHYRGLDVLGGHRPWEPAGSVSFNLYPQDTAARQAASRVSAQNETRVENLEAAYLDILRVLWGQTDQATGRLSGAGGKDGGTADDLAEEDLIARALAAASLGDAGAPGPGAQHAGRRASGPFCWPRTRSAPWYLARRPC